jgi:hypothetical protein
VPTRTRCPVAFDDAEHAPSWNTGSPAYDGELIDPNCRQVEVADTCQTLYGGAVDVERAAELYAEGWSRHQIGPQLAFDGPP